MYWLIIVGAVVATIASIYFGRLAAEKRRKALIAWSQPRGLTFSSLNQSGFVTQYPTFDCLQRGSDRYAYNILTGEWKQRNFTGFDYHYKTESTDSKGRRQVHHHHFSAVIIRSGFPMKHLQIRTEGLFDKIGEMFGFDDIDFESAEFSRKFSIKAKDRKWAYDVLHPRTIEFLMAAPTFPILFDSKSVIAWRDHKFTVQEFEQAADLITGILDRFPEYLVQQQTQGPPLPI